MWSLSLLSAKSEVSSLLSYLVNYVVESLMQPGVPAHSFFEQGRGHNCLAFAKAGQGVMIAKP